MADVRKKMPKKGVYSFYYFAYCRRATFYSDISEKFRPSLNFQNYQIEIRTVGHCPKFSIFSQSVSLTQYVVLSACLFQLAYCLNDQAYFA